MKLFSSLANNESFILDRRWEYFPERAKFELEDDNKFAKIPISVRGTSKILVAICAKPMDKCENIIIQLWNPGNFWHHYWISTDDNFFSIQHFHRDHSFDVAYNPLAYYNVRNISLLSHMNHMSIENMNLEKLSLYKSDLFIKSVEVPSGVLKLHDCKYFFKSSFNFFSSIDFQTATYIQTKPKLEKFY